jgi:phosphonoacetate hydrolase
MDRMAIILCIDGCGIDYLKLSSIPFLDQLSREGYFQEVNSMIPSVTNVNAVSLVTGQNPDQHGITTNFYFDRTTGEEVFMESSTFIKTSSILEHSRKRGLKTALITSKEKLRTLLHRGTTISFSAEDPHPAIVADIGAPPPIYSIDVNIWLLRALRRLIRQEDPSLIFAMTTDYAMHTFSPETTESQSHMAGLDHELAQTYDLVNQMGKDVLLCVVADHGMSRKNRAINLELILKQHGISAKLNTIIADRYVVHHRNLGGAAYLYLDDRKDKAKCISVLHNLDGVEYVMDRCQASRLYHLDSERIGDIFVLGDKTTVFGLIDQPTTEVSIRSHGSLHEAKVPLIINKKKGEIETEFTHNKDLVPLVKSWLNRN